MQPFIVTDIPQQKGGDEADELHTVREGEMHVVNCKFKKIILS